MYVFFDNPCCVVLRNVSLLFDEFYFTRYSTLLQLDELNEVHCSVIGHARKRTENAHLSLLTFSLVDFSAVVGTEEASGDLFSFVVSISAQCCTQKQYCGVGR